jgi:BCD family chlorophyll transporter-like MFS transporter
MRTPAPFGWGRVARLGLVQACIGAVVVLTTSTLNRVMVVELALPALLPGLLVALHYAVQLLRPRMGHGTDRGGRHAPWIRGGMAVLASGGFLAALATVWMATAPLAGLLLAVLAFALVGVGVSAAGTALLVLLTRRVPAPRRAASATLVWLMMIVGFALTAGLAGRWLEPFSPERLLAVSAGVSVLALLGTLLALYRLEDGPGAPAGGTAAAAAATTPASAAPPFREALRGVWAEPVARRFTVFVFVSMLAFSAQDLILEPFAGLVHGYSPGRSTQLSGVQHGGVLLGMLMVAGSTLLSARWPAQRWLAPLASLRGWAVGGCLASALALLALAASGPWPQAWPLGPCVFALGVANGAFSIGAIGSMMRLASEGRAEREGVRMGLWGAAQAVAFGLGGVLGTAASDLARWLIGSPGPAYGFVFALEAALFLASAALAWRIAPPAARPAPHGPLWAGVGSP